MAASTQLRKKSILGAKIETTIGTAISLSGTNATYNVYDLEVQPLIDMIQRPGQGSFGRLPAVQAARMGVFRFKTDAIGGASAPASLAAFMPGCGWVDTAGTYSPKTLTPTAAGGVKTLTLGAYRDGLYKQIHGAMGKWTLELIPGQPAMWAFEFTGVWDDPTDVALVTPTYVTTVPPRFASATLTLGAFAPKISRITIDSGNDIYMRPDASTAFGCAYAIVKDRLIKVTMDPEADVVAERDTHGIWKGLTTAAFTCTWGSTGNQLTIAGPKLQMINVQEGDRDGVNIDTVEFQANKSADAGDDELTVAYA